MKIGIARLYTKNCSLNFNYKNVIKLYKEATKNDIDIIVFPRLSFTGLNINNNFNNKKFINSYIEYMKKLINLTIGEKTKILIGNPCIEDTFLDSVFFIDDGYIDSISSRKEINKNNIFNDYKYFDKNLTLNQFIYQKKKFTILISDDIYSNFNVFLVNDNKPDYVFCFDTSIKNIEERKKQLIKISKFANCPVFYINNATIYNCNYFKGELILINEDFDIKHYDIYKKNEIFYFDIDCEDGTELFINKNNSKSNFDISYLLKKERCLIDIKNINKEDLKYIKNFKVLDENIISKYINIDLFNSLSEESKNELKDIISKNIDYY